MPTGKGTRIRAAGGGRERLRVVVRGAVQGVGFRPFVFRLASRMKLPGWVNNAGGGVYLEVEGTAPKLAEFLLALEAEKPSISYIQSLESTYLDPAGYEGFEIRESGGGPMTTLMMPDIATCPECRAEIFDPSNRRYLYPFTNCTLCGPRFTIIEHLPYDRPWTSMKGFTMCGECQAEYEDPRNRRFHAQPNACPKCGPQVRLVKAGGSVLAERQEAMQRAAAALRAGHVVAVKGIGGYQLMVDAGNEEAVRRLRERKQRESKPLAVMMPSLEEARRHLAISPTEQRLLCGPEAPIVLLARRNAAGIAPSVAPGNPYLGAMLPYSPLHLILLKELGIPLVATSGNLSGEPICTTELEAFESLSEIADEFLIHNRPILRHADDSIARVMMGREMVLRRARGYTPMPVMTEQEMPPVIAYGAHQKNTVALTAGKDVFVSQHIGDLETARARSVFENVTGGMCAFHGCEPLAVACDLHPDYLSTQAAVRQSLPVIRVQHHYAHALGCMAENGVKAPALAFVWDGSGFGTDGTVWGGETLLVDANSYRRIAHLRSFRLPGNETAVREPRRAAAGLVYEALGAAALDPEGPALGKAFRREEISILLTMLEKGLNSPLTSSAGRLFDGVASLLGLRQISGHEGQAAMELEFAAASGEAAEGYTISLETPPGEAAVLDWRRMIVEILADLRCGFAPAGIARRFHNTLAETIVKTALHVSSLWSSEGKLLPVLLTGGCFQNRLLTELAVERLRAEGFACYWHQRIPPNDGGISLGQAVAAARVIRRDQEFGGTDVSGDSGKAD